MAKNFLELGVSSTLVQGLDALGISKPTPIQAEAIPHLLAGGGDFIAQAQTGTGKTAAFGLPLLEKIDPKHPGIQGLVIAPTRELAKQIGKQLFRFTKFCPSKLFIEVTAGGDKIDVQAARLKRPTHIVVATPGRLMDLLKLKALDLSGVRHLILDEADEMLSMGFQKELATIFELTAQRQSAWLFSATFQGRVKQLVEGHLDPKARFLKIDQAHVVNPNIDHRYVICERTEKTEIISNFLKKQDTARGLIFCRTRAGAVKLGEVLSERGFPVGVLQGDLSQKDRDKLMRAFKKERLRYLIATDVAARGIDVEGLAFVIHHRLPDAMQYYTHRSGRTARAGKRGTSLCLIEPQERQKITEMENALNLSFTHVDER